MLSHDVYFTLKDKSPEAKNRLIAACREKLSGHEGCLLFAAGARVEDLQRPVNDQNFDVALHVVFRDHASQDAYQVHQDHLDFIKENQDNWDQVRVFDSSIET